MGKNKIAEMVKLTTRACMLLAFLQSAVFAQEKSASTEKKGAEPVSSEYTKPKTELDKIRNNYITCDLIWLCFGSLSLNSYSFFDILGKTNDKDLMINGNVNVDVNLINVDLFIYPSVTNYRFGFLSAALGQGLVGSQKVQFWKLTTAYQTSLLRIEFGVANVWLTEKTNLDNTGFIFGVGIPIVGILKDLKQ